MKSWCAMSLYVLFDYTHNNRIYITTDCLLFSTILVFLKKEVRLEFLNKILEN